MANTQSNFEAILNKVVEVITTGLPPLFPTAVITFQPEPKRALKRAFAFVSPAGRAEEDGTNVKREVLYEVKITAIESSLKEESLIFGMLDRQEKLARLFRNRDGDDLPLTDASADTDVIIWDFAGDDYSLIDVENRFYTWIESTIIVQVHETIS